MADKNFVGTFQSDDQVLNRIAELKVHGFTDNDIYIVTQNEGTITLLRGLTDVDVRPPEGNWLDRFKSFLSGDEPVMGAFTNMGFSDEKASIYYSEVMNGRILLYVDREYGSLFPETQSGFHNDNVDPNIGSNLIVDDVVNENNTYTQHYQESINEVDSDNILSDETHTGEYVADDVISDNTLGSTPEQIHTEEQVIENEIASNEFIDDGEGIPISVMNETKK